MRLRDLVACSDMRNDEKNVKVRFVVPAAFGWLGASANLWFFSEDTKCCNQGSFGIIVLLGRTDYPRFGRWVSYVFGKSRSLLVTRRIKFPRRFVGVPPVVYILPRQNLTTFNQPCFSQKLESETRTTVSNGYLGSRNDEERSEMRYVMRIAEFSESSNL